MVLRRQTSSGSGLSGGSSSSGGSTPSNSQPAFSSSTSFSVVENNTAAGTVEADDADSNDTLALSIEGGADADLFELGVCNASRCTSNSLSFKTAPDFEAPGDATGDNVYEVTLGAYDGTVTVTQDVSVTVTNAVEGRVVDAPLSGASGAWIKMRTGSAMCNPMMWPAQKSFRQEIIVLPSPQGPLMRKVIIHWLRGRHFLIKS